MTAAGSSTIHPITAMADGDEALGCFLLVDAAWASRPAAIALST